MCLSGSEGNADGVAINLTFFYSKGCRARDSILNFLLRVGRLIHCATQPTNEEEEEEEAPFAIYGT